MAGTRKAGEREPGVTEADRRAWVKDRLKYFEAQFARGALTGALTGLPPEASQVVLGAETALTLLPDRLVARIQAEVQKRHRALMTLPTQSALAGAVTLRGLLEEASLSLTPADLSKPAPTTPAVLKPSGTEKMPDVAQFTGDKTREVAAKKAGRGRKPKFTIEQLVNARRAVDAHKGNREAAKSLYGKDPSRDQIHNVPTLLKYHREAIDDAIGPLVEKIEGGRKNEGPRK